MKNALTIVLITFWIAVLGIILAGFLQPNMPLAGTPTVRQTTGLPLPQPGQKEIVLSAAEVAKHNTFNDCWMIIDSKVYNVSSYVSHPGGPQEILKYCGKEASQAFHTKDGSGRGHSNRAQQMLASMYIGDLNSVLPIVGVPVKAASAKLPGADF